MSNDINHAAECAAPAQTPTLRERLMRRLFPARHLAAPDQTEEFPAWMRHEIYILADWKDRLRLLVSGRARATLFVELEIDPGATRTKTTFWVAPPETGKGPA